MSFRLPRTFITFENGIWHTESFRQKQFVSVNQLEFLFLTGIRQLEIGSLFQVCVHVCVGGEVRAFTQN